MVAHYVALPISYILVDSACEPSGAIVAIVANWDTTQVLIKQSGTCPNREISQFAIPLFSHYSKKNMMANAENILNRSYPRFASTTTTTTAIGYPVASIETMRRNATP